ncbi:MAG: RNA-binding S4 domain-containing protein [Limnochordia bacterium]|jgi:ribosome-associated protein|nr:RNA-binding S4 domain-containing protein [Bacillota bacterium]HOB08338.1 RNA-binding S4 domain-containing protein [Limnochordia bacterium]NLH30908.1 RNA-binding S4 domain-containing protein [Bacillota bacterium]HPT92624.1 RNA-binding S4 domain-containing protein [Limnochordia bacterium]HPZ30580.1 RNA-binding S4 domain-containing protein [Limnochordia bacterium]
METIEIKTESIQLDQLLKWAGIAATGGEAKLMIQGGQVLLNGTVETRRSKKVYRSDVVTVGARTIKVI